MSIRRLYESTFIINAALEDPDVEAVIRRVTDYIENHGGTFVEMNKWGRRRLAYPIKKKYNGYYVYMAFEAASEILPLVERFFNLEENVLRHLNLELSEKLREMHETTSFPEVLHIMHLLLTSIYLKVRRSAIWQRWHARKKRQNCLLRNYPKFRSAFQ